MLSLHVTATRNARTKRNHSRRNDAPIAAGTNRPRRASRSDAAAPCRSAGSSRETPLPGQRPAAASCPQTVYGEQGVGLNLGTPDQARYKQHVGSGSPGGLGGCVRRSAVLPERGRRCLADHPPAAAASVAGTATRIRTRPVGTTGSLRLRFGAAANAVAPRAGLRRPCAHSPRRCPMRGADSRVRGCVRGAPSTGCTFR